jgi:predicted dehydrogenase
VEVDDAASFLAEFESGATGVFVATRHALQRKNQLTFELDASRGALRFNWDVRDELQVALIDDPAPVGGFRVVSMGPPHPNAWWPIAGLGGGYLETSVNQVRDFVTAIVDGSSARPSFADAAHVQYVVDAVLASARSDRWEAVAPSST